MERLRNCMLLLVFAALLLVGCGSGGSDAELDAQTKSSDEEAISQEAESIDEEDGFAGDEAASDDATDDETTSSVDDEKSPIDEDGTYTSKEDVALYLHTYGHLPSNYIGKDEAEDAGWKTEGLDLDEACPGMSIGGDRFGNREGRLPSAKGRKWFECDIDYNGGRSRGPKRIVYSNDGLIYYTEDHYESFERLY